MVHITIDGKKLVASEGTHLLEVAEQAGIAIPTLCDYGELEHFTSCMVCLVKDLTSGKLLPACSALAENGMEVITINEEIREARKTALELLLSEHVGDCEAPCRIACPAFMNIPLMNRLIAAGRTDEALEVVMNDIALPGVLGRICPAPCEGACKRKPIDKPVSICLLKRYAADHGAHIPQQETTPPGAKKVAIIGSGPAGLAAAFYLQKEGVQAFVYDKNELPGGSLRYAIDDEKLHKRVLDEEVMHIQNRGVTFMQQQVIDAGRFESLRAEYDAVVIATGDYSRDMDSWGLENNGKQIIVNKNSYLTKLDRVFAIGNANRSMQLAIRSVAQGKEVAVSLLQLFGGVSVSGEERRFNSSIGKLLPEEYAEYLKEGTDDPRQEPVKVDGGGLSRDQAHLEAARCLHCDCRKPDTCKLRELAGSYEVAKKRFNYSARKPLKKYWQQGLLVYEPGKCIKCGICVRLTAKYDEKFGFTFIGRGFDVEIGIPFNQSLGKALEKTAHKVAQACPTGALALEGD